MNVVPVVFLGAFSKVGSIERTSLFRSTVFGAAAGYLTFRAGRHVINDPGKPIVFDSREYYWNADLHTPSEKLPVQCVNKIDPLDPQFGRVYYANDSRPTEIVYGCAEEDYCCGYDCCQENIFFTSLLCVHALRYAVNVWCSCSRLLVMILVFSVLGVLCIEAFRWSLNCMYICKYGHPRDLEPLSI
uniref:CX domain-containing protein n=1 Tax=Angiostrongylus cantonensis TaxID=6313 RepID=A0A0K0DIF4_ANGCA